MDDARIFHVNVNCSDLARSRAFFAEAFGLDAAVRTSPPTAQPGTAFGLDRAWWDAWILVGANAFEGGAIDLLEWREPRPVGAPPASFLECGFQRVGIGVPDLDAAVDRIGRLGGRVWSEPTAHALPDGSHVRLVMANDPDGTAIECIEGAATRVSFVAVCCSDLEYSLAFYRALGFEERACFASDTADAAHLHLPGPMGMDEIMLSAPGGGEVRLVLVGFRVPLRASCARSPRQCARDVAYRVAGGRSRRGVRRARGVADRDARADRGDADGPGSPRVAFRVLSWAGPRSHRAHRTATVNEFPGDFFARQDEADDARFYDFPRFVTHIDDAAIRAVGALYEELELRGAVLDLMSSWVSHFVTAPDRLTVLGLNAEELAANPQAAEWVVHDLNADPVLPFAADTFDHATCCVSVDYLTRPVEVFREVGRVVRPGGTFVCTFSNRLFPTKAIRGWLFTDSDAHQQIVADYFAGAGRFEPATRRLCTPLDHRGDPLYGVWATVRAAGVACAPVDAGPAMDTERAPSGAPTGGVALLGAALIGAAISVALGVYGREHDPAGQALFTLGFSGTINMKAWLATIALSLAVVQILLALWLYGKIGRNAPIWVGPTHRLVGTLTFLVTLPVAYHCLWSLGFETDASNARRFWHSLFGCAFYGAFATKVLCVRAKGLPGWALPVIGGLVFSLLVGLWFTSVFWFFDNSGFPSF